ncbi:hypothetical protein CR918_17680 [Stenotrophomonas indicatrix]|nr:hypothetical protein CR918_17680 [Stenotrophomonas indicatrix]
MTMKPACAAFVLTLMLPACAHRVATTVEVEPRDELLCAIAGNPGQHDGEELVLSATYITDNRHFEMLRNSHCGEGGHILVIGRHGSSDSVKRFYAEQKRICLKRDAPAVCNTTAVVEVSGRVRLQPEGLVVFDIEEVRSFRFNE